MAARAPYFKYHRVCLYHHVACNFSTSGYTVRERASHCASQMRKNAFIRAQKTHASALSFLLFCSLAVSCFLSRDTNTRGKTKRRNQLRHFHAGIIGRAKCALVFLRECLDGRELFRALLPDELYFSCGVQLAAGTPRFQLIKTTEEPNFC